MPLDPFADPYEALYGGVRPPQSAVPQLPRLSPEDQAGLLGTIGSGALHGLGYVGSSLSKAFGGRAIRGMLGGKPEELLSIIPFSDTLGITDPANEVHGSDLLGGNKDTPFLSPEGLGGLGLDIALDPLTYLSFGAHGALTGLGRQAAKIGIRPATGAARAAGLAAGTPEATRLAQAVHGLAPTVAPSAAQMATVAGQSLGGHVGVSLPFMGNAATFDLSAPINAISGMAGKIPGAGAVSSAAGDVGRFLKAGFGKQYRDLLGEAEQAIAPRFSAAEEAGKEAGRLKGAEVARAIGGPDLLGDPQGMRYLQEGGMGPVSAGQQRGAAIAGPYLEGVFKRLEDMGFDMKAIKQYFPRSVSEPDIDVAASFFANRGKGGGVTASRADMLRDLPANLVDRMAMDPFVGTAARTAPDAASAEAYLIKNFGINPTVAPDMASFLWSLDPRRQKFGVFTKDSAHDLINYAAKAESKLSMAEQLYPTIAEYAGQATPNSMPVGELLSTKLGMTDKARDLAFNAADQAGKLGTGTLAQKQAEFAKLHLPLEVANGLGAIFTPNVNKDNAFVKLMKSLYDVPSNLFKGHVTMPFPGFHERNAVTSLGWIQTVLTGSPEAAYEGNQLMTKLLRGGTIDGISSWPAYKHLGLNDAQVSEHVGNWMFAKGLTDRGHVADVLGHNAGPGIINAIPGLDPNRAVGLSAIPEYIKSYVPKTLEQANPLKVQGIGGAGASTYAPIKAGEDLATVIEQTGRGGGALALLKQGYSPDMAAALTKAAHVDYGALTGFEREVMRRMVPFYSWARGVIPYNIAEIASNPGGLTATAVKAAARTEGGQPGFVPEYLGTGTAVETGKTDEGKTRYLSGFGLPHEDIGNLTSPRTLLGQLNPIAKFAIESAMGRQLSTGRELSQVRPLPAELEGVAPPWTQNLIANSPLARYASTLRNITDERSTLPGIALSLGTGMRMTDVDPAQAQRNAVTQYVEQSMANNPLVHQFHQMTIRPQDRGNLTPEELRLLQLYQAARRRP